MGLTFDVPQVHGGLYQSELDYMGERLQAALAEE